MNKKTNLQVYSSQEITLISDKLILDPDALGAPAVVN
jgi:hypothetical protein